MTGCAEFYGKGVEDLERKDMEGRARAAKEAKADGRNERRWSVVTANYTIVGRLTMESGPELRASRRNEFFPRFESRGLF